MKRKGRREREREESCTSLECVLKNIESGFERVCVCVCDAVQGKVEEEAHA